MMKYGQTLLYPFPFYATKIINPFLNSRIAINYDKMLEHSANVEILIKGIETLL